MQYGLTALQGARITPEQFVDLNEKVGGLDIDWNWQPQRSEADPAALEIAYRVVSTAMAVRHLGRSATEGEPDQLVTEADTERGKSGPREIAYIRKRVVDCCGVARTVRKKESVWI